MLFCWFFEAARRPQRRRPFSLARVDGVKVEMRICPGVFVCLYANNVRVEGRGRRWTKSEDENISNFTFLLWELRKAFTDSLGVQRLETQYVLVFMVRDPPPPDIRYFNWTSLIFCSVIGFGGTQEQTEGRDKTSENNSNYALFYLCKKIEQKHWPSLSFLVARLPFLARGQIEFAWRAAALIIGLAGLVSWWSVLSPNWRNEVAKRRKTLDNDLLASESWTTGVNAWCLLFDRSTLKVHVCWKTENRKTQSFLVAGDLHHSVCPPVRLQNYSFFQEQ